MVALSLQLKDCPAPTPFRTEVLRRGEASSTRCGRGPENRRPATATAYTVGRQIGTTPVHGGRIASYDAVGCKVQTSSTAPSHWPSSEQKTRYVRHRGLEQRCHRQDFYVPAAIARQRLITRKAAPQ